MALGKKTGGKKKGSKNKQTMFKEQVYADSFEKLGAYITGNGAEKYIEEISALKGKDFVYGYTALLEYFKPKLQRLTLEGGDKDKPINISFKG